MSKRRLSVDRQKIPRTYRDLLGLYKEMGEAVEIDEEVDWYLEMGAILRHAYETDSAQPIFNCVKESPGFRAAEFGPTRSRAPGRPWRRLGAMLGLPEDASMMEMQDAYLRARAEAPHPSRVVASEDAPCKMHKWVGDAIDLEKLPAPLLHDGDGGRYLQTAGAITVRTPDGTWTNCSISRAMIVDKKTMSGLWLPFQHNGQIYRMWQKLGQDCPFAIAFGVPPVLASQLGAAPPDGRSEYDYASALLGEPLDLVKCETHDLLVPASSEIVIEGFVSATEHCTEGPFGEFPGYLPLTTIQNPKQTITCVTFRDNAILPVANPGIPVDSTHANGFFSVGDAVVALREAGLPIIDGMYTVESALHWFVVRVPDDWHRLTGLKVDEFINAIAKAYWTSHVAHTAAKIIVVGEDIPPDDPIKVTWAFATRNHPVLGVYRYEDYDSDGAGLQIYLDVATKLRGRGGLVVYSCLPIQEKVNHPIEQVLSFEDNYPLPLQEKIRSRWQQWGF